MVIGYQVLETARWGGAKKKTQTSFWRPSHTHFWEMIPANSCQISLYKKTRQPSIPPRFSSNLLSSLGFLLITIETAPQDLSKPFWSNTGALEYQDLRPLRSVLDFILHRNFGWGIRRHLKPGIFSMEFWGAWCTGDAHICLICLYSIYPGIAIC